MQMDEKPTLAQELARTFAQFKRLGWHGSCQRLRQSEFMLLGTLKHLIGSDAKGVKVSDLSARMQITPAAVTHIINPLEEGGYIERLADPEDRRIVLLKLTSKGKQTIKSMEKAFLEIHEGLVGFLGEQDSKELIRLLSTTFTYLKERRSKDGDKF